MNLYKARFETPKECLDRFVMTHPEYRGVKATYAGRLDPLAEGVLPILFGDAVHKKDEVSAMQKEYRVKILFGFATDTGDMLGKLTRTDSTPVVRLQEIIMAIESLVGTREQRYPLYSSKTVEGKALHEYGRSGTEVALPTHMVTVDAITLTALTTVTVAQVESLVSESCTRVRGDFRQKEILALWEDSLRLLYGKKFPVAEMVVTCGSGTYMRVLAEEIGEKLGVPALAYSIIRTKVGDLKIEDAINPHHD